MSVHGPTASKRQSTTRDRSPANCKSACMGASASAPVEFDGPDLISQLPDTVLAQVLTYVDVRTLLRSCALLSHRFARLLRSRFFIEYSCANGIELLPAVWCREQALPVRVWQRVAARIPFGRNLIQNPSAEQELQHWDVRRGEPSGRNTNNGWLVECPPAGADLHPNATVTHCFASTYNWCQKTQTIQLVNAGIDPSLIGLVPLRVTFSEDWAGRFDCGCVYELQVQAIDARGKVLHESELIERREEQWLGKAWHTETGSLLITDPKTVALRFTSRGQDTQFWAGHYGSKMTNAQLRLSAETDRLA